MFFDCYNQTNSYNFRSCLGIADVGTRLITVDGAMVMVPLIKRLYQWKISGVDQAGLRASGFQASENTGHSAEDEQTTGW